jgi:hypothetical protein
MSEVWYYVEGNETRGPITVNQLVQFLSQLPTHRGVLVWREGFTDWIEAGNVREIVEKLVRSPPVRRRASVVPPPLRVSGGREASGTFDDRNQQQFAREKIAVQARKQGAPWPVVAALRNLWVKRFSDAGST